MITRAPRGRSGPYKSPDGNPGIHLNKEMKARENCRNIMRGRRNNRGEGHSLSLPFARPSVIRRSDFKRRGKRKRERDEKQSG